jgi:hypothetical protein
MTRLRLLCAVVLLGAAGIATQVAAQADPNKVLRVAFPSLRPVSIRRRPTTCIPIM